MKIFQKRTGTTASFVFGETQLTYVFRYGASVHEHVVDYFEILRGRKHTAQRDWSRLQLGILLTILGAIALVAQARLTGLSGWSSLWFAPGALYLALFAFFQGHFVTYQAAGNPFWIIDNKRARDIVVEIDRRRRDRLAEIYGPLNLMNDPATEIRKIEWLVGESVLTRDQADDQIARVTAAAAARAAALADTAAEQAGTHDMFRREAIAV